MIHHVGCLNHGKSQSWWAKLSVLVGWISIQRGHGPSVASQVMKGVIKQSGIAVAVSRPPTQGWFFHGRQAPSDSALGEGPWLSKLGGFLSHRGTPNHPIFEATIESCSHYRDIMIWRFPKGIGLPPVIIYFCNFGLGFSHGNQPSSELGVSPWLKKAPVLWRWPKLPAKVKTVKVDDQAWWAPPAVIKHGPWGIGIGKRTENRTSIKLNGDLSIMILSIFLCPGLTLTQKWIWNQVSLPAPCLLKSENMFLE